MKKIILVIAILIGSTIFSKAQAFDWYFTGRVTYVEASYIPNSVYFKMDTGTGSCPAGTWLVWDGSFSGASQPANVKAIYALLLSAAATGKSVTFYGNNSGCVGEHVYFVGD